MYIKNNNGHPKIDPCGTPEVILNFLKIMAHGSQRKRHKYVKYVTNKNILLFEEQGEVIPKALYCYPFCFLSTKTVCIINVWGCAEILPLFLNRTRDALLFECERKFALTAYRNES